ncbi:MAG TPA: transglutaminase-like domain-containing protein [Vicinamibacteria bacterium]|nr:transglutaminase-like domain-containing protein [Vicinamibacteria bacterium]
MIERLLTRWPSLPKGIAAPLSLITLMVWTGAMVLVVRKATEQTALALTSDLAAYGERARWSGIYYRGEKIGFSVSQMTERPGGFKLQEDGQMLITLMGDSIASKLHTEVNVDSQYMLQDFSFSLDPGTGPLSIKGVLETPTRLSVKITSAGSEKSRTFDLKEPPILSLNLPKRLLAMGLTEGARHQIQIFDPATLTNGLAIIEVGKREVVRILDKPVPAFRMTMTYSGITATSWITEVGDIVKEESTMGMVVVRESRERAIALAMSSEVKTDMIETAAIQPDSKRNIDDALSLASLRLEFSGAELPGTPEERNGAGQTVTGNIVEIVDPNTLKAGPIPADIEASLAPEAFIESDAPEIVAETARALERVGADATARKKAELLVRYVNAALEKKPTMSIPSAVEVLRTRVGDCNEHTALYVAMARAAKIPSRVAIGLVSMRGAFYYHAWPEVFVGDAKSTVDGKTGVWIPVDPTLNQFPADVSHVRLARGGFERQTAILPLLGRAKIRILEMVDGPSQSNTTALVGAENTRAPALAIDFPAPQSKESCWRRPARR